MEVEEIPHEDRVFFRVPRSQMRHEDRLHEGVFRDRGDGMSVDWEKYSTANETRARGRLPPEDYGILAFLVGAIRGIRTPQLTVVHEPLEENQAHAGVHGVNANKTMARLKLFALVDGWEVHPASPVATG